MQKPKREESSQSALAFDEQQNESAHAIFTDKEKEPPKRIRLCPVCGINPLSRGQSSCSDRCRKRKERILKQYREETLLYGDDDDD
jgi:predicted nucleic acid-binding Zn ribbon protein